MLASVAEEVRRRKGQAAVTRADLTRCLADVLGTDRLALLRDDEREIEPGQVRAFRDMVERLVAGVPLAYVLGYEEFYGRRFRVDESVLVPRPETELLVELAIAELGRDARVFEPCTGSGCIAISLVLERPDVSVLASDVHEPALEIARENARALDAEARVDFALGDYWQASGGRRFDALVVNPPYVDPNRPELLDPHVAKHEPSVALFLSSDDPLHAYHTLLEGGVAGLDSGALVLAEVGVDTAEGALELARGHASYVDATLLDDLQALPRILRCRRAGV